MKLFLTSMLGLVLLIPILYFVPLQLNRQLKLPLIFGSFGLALIGSWIDQFLPISSTILILFLLALLCAYFIGKRAVHTATDQQQDGVDVQWGSSEQKANPTDLMLAETTLGTEQLAGSLSISENERLIGNDEVETEESNGVEMIDISRDSLPELEDDFVLSELPQRAFSSEEKFSSDEDALEEELLKERSMLFEVLDVELDMEQEKKNSPSASMKQGLDNIDK